MLWGACNTSWALGFARCAPLPGAVAPCARAITCCRTLCKTGIAGLTGESEPITATATPSTLPYTEATNMAWMGTTVVAGSGQGIVAQIGDRTRMGSVRAHLEFWLGIRAGCLGV